MAGMMGQPGPPIRVSHMGGHRFLIRMGRHAVAVDQPVHAGGLDGAPTAVDLFVGSLAACIAHYARGYLARHGIDADDLQVSATFEVGQRPPRVTAINVHVKPPADLPPQQYAAFRAVASHCTVHNTLLNPPVVSLELESAALDGSWPVEEDAGRASAESFAGGGAR
jgi:putative redox protein